MASSYYASGRLSQIGQQTRFMFQQVQQSKKDVMDRLRPEMFSIRNIPTLFILFSIMYFVIPCYMSWHWMSPLANIVTYINRAILKVAFKTIILRFVL